VNQEEKEKELEAKLEAKLLEEKKLHVLSSGQTRAHRCHADGCEEQVPPAMFMCKPHWFKLPKGLRDRVWSAYRLGQEKDGRASERYLSVTREASS
jgi:hypothetical protein